MKYIVNLIIFSLFLITPIYAQNKDFKKDFGAKGDGITDDSEAWYRAIDYYSKNKSQKGKLFIPKGVYRIGTQKERSGRFRYSAHGQKLENVSNLEIIGEVDKNGNPTSVFKYHDGLYFGLFDKNGQPAKVQAFEKRAEIGVFLLIMNTCTNITIKNLELDGNLPKIKLGLKSKADLEHVGIRATYVNNLKLENLYVHHFGMDGIIIRTPYTDGYNCYVNNCRLEYNARNGLTFSAGKGLKVENSSFKYTGRGGLFISPGANVDIENHEMKPLENIYFNNCVLDDNTGGSGSLNIAGISAVKNLLFENCTITTTSMYAIQSNFSSSRDFTFKNCTIEGIIEMQVNGKVKTGNETTKFINCTISDNKNNRDFGLKRCLINVFDKVEFTNCDFYLWSKRPMLHSYPNGKNDTKKNTIVFKSCTFRDIDSKQSLDREIKRLSRTPDRMLVQ